MKPDSRLFTCRRLIALTAGLVLLANAVAAGSGLWFLWHARTHHSVAAAVLGLAFALDLILLALAARLWPRT